MAPAEERVDAEAPQSHEGDVLAKKACKKALFWPFSTKTVIVPHAGGIDLIEGFFVARNVSSCKSSGKKAPSGANGSVMLSLAGSSTTGGGSPCR